MKVSQVLGKRIEYLRKSKGWSQLELALESEVNKNYLCDLEKGRRNPSLEILERIADALNVSLEELFKGVHSIPEI